MQGKTERSTDDYELFQLFVQTVQEYAIFAMDAGGCIVHWNIGAARIMGFEAAEVLGRQLYEIFTPEDLQARVPELELATAARLGRAADERWHVRKNGSRFWGLGIVTPIHAADGTLLGFGKILRDRTDLKQLQEALQRQNEALARADELKNRFLATLAHELRNPQIVLANSAQLLRRCGADNPVLQNVAEMIERQVLQSKRLVDDLADLARSSHGKMQLQTRRLDLRGMADLAVQALRATMDERRHELCVMQPGLPVEIEGDPERIQQILTNLLTNAARYTPPGGRIGLSVAAEGGEAVVRVQDTGIGIPPEQLAEVFELFTQVHTQHAESQAGLGIGLALARELVVLHGGTIQARSDGPGKGSEFIVRLPICR